MFSWYKYLIVNLVFSHLGFWRGNLSLIAPFPDLCLLVLSFTSILLLFSGKKCGNGDLMLIEGWVAGGKTLKGAMTFR